MLPTRYVTAAHTATSYVETHPRSRPAPAPAWLVTEVTEVPKPRTAGADAPSTGPVAALAARFAKLRKR